MMTESEFLRHTDGLFAHIEEALDDLDCGADCQTAGNVLTIEADDGVQVVINRHTPNQELWIAAKSGGYHFSLQNGEWLSTRDGRGFFAVLDQTLSETLGQAVHIEPFSV